MADGLAVERELLVAEAAGAHVLDLLRQLVENGGLDAAQHERGGETPQALQVPVVRLDVGAVAVAEVVFGAEVAG